MQAIVSEPRVSFDVGNEPTRVNFMLVCDSFDAVEKAMRVYHRLSQDCSEDLVFNRRFFEFRELREDTHARRGIRAAALADVVIVACKSELPSFVKDWIDEWSAQRNLEDGALVGLVAAEAGEGRSDVHSYLTATAAKARMDYFPGEFSSKTNHPFSIAGTAPNRRPEFMCFGINE